MAKLADASHREKQLFLDKDDQVCFCVSEVYDKSCFP